MAGVMVQGYKTAEPGALDVTPLLERARTDAKLRARLEADPFGTAKEEGFSVSLDDARRYLNLPEGADVQTEAQRQLHIYLGGAAK